MNQATVWKDQMRLQFDWHGSARLHFLCLFLRALLKVRTANLVGLSLAFGDTAKLESSNKRTQLLLPIFPAE